MKSILLASASLVGFAGAAAAEVTFGGSATLGYNDNVKNGFYWEGDLAVTMTRALDNGLTAAASFGLNITDDNLGNDPVTVDGNWVISLTSETAGLTFGDTDQAAEKLYSGIDGMDYDGFDEDGIGEAILRGDIKVGGFDLALSYNVDPAADGDSLTGMQVGAAGAFGNFNMTFGYQDDSFTGYTIIAITGTTTFSGASVGVGFAQASDTGQSIGLSVKYPFGPVTLGAFIGMNTPNVGDAYNNYGISADYVSGPLTVNADYTVNGDDDGVFGIEGAYVATSVLTVKFGILDSGDVFYVAGEMTLGGDATFTVVYADDGDDTFADDEIGDPEYYDGITAELGLKF